MHGYLSWDNKRISDFSEKNISDLYEQGFVFTRLGKGEMIQTRSVRIDLRFFKLSSENKRVLKKTENVILETVSLPHPTYNWKIHKLGFNFYTKKFGEKTFSANKIKELLTSDKSNYNLLLVYKLGDNPIGYCICYQNKNLLHYSYPFYELESEIKNLGIGMMTKAIVWAKEQGKKYIYLGSAQNPTAMYKTQFSGFEWFNGKSWIKNKNELKEILHKEY